MPKVKVRFQPSLWAVGVFVDRGAGLHIDLMPLPCLRVTLEWPRRCRECGCTDDRACEGGCWWVEPDLCSACLPGGVPGFEQDDDDPFEDGDDPFCCTCGGTGFIVTCCDDICHGMGYCIHGDGIADCPDCGAEWDVSALPKDFRIVPKAVGAQQAAPLPDGGA